MTTPFQPIAQVRQTVPMAIVTRGFTGRRRDSASRLPPGQYPPPTSRCCRPGRPRPSRPGSGSSASSPRRGPARLGLGGLLALPAESITVDLHCVTRWSKLDTGWTGVSLDTLFADVDTTADYAVVSAYGGYTTNLPLEDLVDGQACLAYRYEGRAARGGARRPGPTARPAPVPVEVGQVGARGSG